MTSFFRHSLIGLLFIGGAMRAEDEESISINDRVNSVYQSIVRIEVVSEIGSNGRMLKTGSTGSGVIIDPSGLVVTNHHVAGKATRLHCRLHDGEELSASLIGADALTDLAVIQLNLKERPANSSSLRVATFGNSDLVRVGDPCFAMGSPAGLSQSVTRGIISNLALISKRGSTFRLDGENIGELVRWLGHDAVIFPGNSGGPLVNSAGEIIGINEVAIASLGGAIPSNLAQKIARELSETGSVKRSWSGLELQPALRQHDQGVLVAGVIENSPADQAGMLPGDLITRVNQTPVNATIEEDLPPVHQLLSSFQPQMSFVIKGRRGEDTKTWEVTPIPREPAYHPEMELKSWGITVRNLSLPSSLEARRNDQEGALVHTVAPGGPSFNAKPKLLDGDIITEVQGIPISSADDLITFSRKFIREQNDSLPALVRFERDLASILTVIQVGPEPIDKRPVEAWKAWLGVGTQVITPDLSKALGLDDSTRGVRLTQVFDHTPAQRAGLLAGDLIFKIDGQIIQAWQPEDIEVFGNMIKQYRTDATVRFSGLRDGSLLEINATLDRRPTPASELPSFEEEFMEFTVRELSFADRAYHRMPEEQTGLLVENVELAGWASLAGMMQGDILLSVNKHPVDNTRDFENQIEELAKEKISSVLFHLKRGIHTLFIEIEPDWEKS